MFTSGDRMAPVDLSLDQPSAMPLGPLEQRIHRAIWSRGSATVREVLQDGSIWQAYNTVLTTTERLFRKGLLSRVHERKAFRYRALCSPDELRRRTTVSGLQRLLSAQDTVLHLSYFVEAVGQLDEKLLDDLQALVEQERAELRLKKRER